ncbi:MAG: hypothetical protein IJT65_06940 [Eubacterium sp.]|nr:hypothetical protein [Eubacterium sp.]
MAKRELAQAVIDSSNACAELKDAAQKYIDSLGTEEEIKYAKFLIAEAEEDICSIDSAIAFLQSDKAKEIFGEELANAKLQETLNNKANGEVFCGCEGCRAAKAIIDNKALLLPPEAPVNEEVPLTKKWYFWVLIALIVIGLIIAICVGASSRSNKTDVTTTESTSVVTSETTTEKKKTTTEEETEEVTKATKLKGIKKVNTVDYSVADDESGFNAVIMYLNSADKDFDGYEIQVIDPYASTTKTKYLKPDTKAVYFETQDTVYMVRARTYKGTPDDSDAQLSEWTELCDSDFIDETKPVEIDTAKWNEISSEKGILNLTD